MSEPSTDLYRVEGHVEAAEGDAPLPKELAVIERDNLLLRGCRIKNTDYVEGLVVYAGRDTKAMLNNSGPRYKRSALEKLTNWDIVWSVEGETKKEGDSRCVVILLLLCITCAVLSSVFLSSFASNYEEVPFLAPINKDWRPELDGFKNFWAFIIVLQVSEEGKKELQVMIPISLYVSVEFIKLGQVFFMSQDLELYYEAVDKRLQCRALNIPEELGQIEYVMSDKTGTLTENQACFSFMSSFFRWSFVAVLFWEETSEDKHCKRGTASSSRVPPRIAPSKVSCQRR